MMTRPGSLLLLSAVVLLCAPCQGWSADSHIGGIQVSPDLRQILIKCDGPVGKHSAFIMQRPYRLVLDFDSTGLARVPGKIAVNRGGISEIRLGSSNNKARIVVDFGDTPVPAFNIERRGDAAVVHLGDAGNGLQPREASERNYPAEPKLPSASGSARTASLKPKPTGAGGLGQAVKYNLPGLQVKKSGLKDNLVFVELVDRRDPKQSYRLVVDFDHKNLDVRQASVSDAGGKLRTFDLAAKDESNNRQVQQVKQIGPRKEVPDEGRVADATDLVKDKYQWGKGSDQTASLDGPHRGAPFRMEQFRLQARNADSSEKQ